MQGDKRRQPVDRREFLKRGGRVAVGMASAGALSGFKGSRGEEFDLIIRGGEVHDGTLSQPYIADIGVVGDRIADVGEITGRAARTLDATGLIVTPGFIDVHNHCDLSFRYFSGMKYLAYFSPSWKGNYNYLYQGVTTVVTGNCGGGYPDLDEWFRLLNSLPFGSNVYHLAPHGEFRQELFGENQPGELSSSQLKAMKDKVEKAMDQGAVGISTGLEYAPGLYATTDELVELAKVVSKHGGLYATHMRDETGKFAENEHGVIKSIKEAIEIGRRAEIPVQISHLKISMPFNDAKASRMLELIEEARSQGMEIHADQYPYDAGSAQLTLLLPNRFKTQVGLREEYKSKSGRLELRAAIEEVFQTVGPERIMISMYSRDHSYEGKTIAEIAEKAGKDPAEIYVEILCSDPKNMAVFFIQDIEIVKALMAPDYVMTASDGYGLPKGFAKPHPRYYGTFPRKLKSFVIDQQIMGLEAGIRSMTSLPAEKFRMTDRGRIEPGAFADINVIDLDSLQDHATYTDPHQYCDGVLYQLVNGTLSIDKGTATGRRNGRALRRI